MIERVITIITKFLYTFAYPIVPFFSFFNIKLEKTFLGIVLTAIFLIDTFFYLIIIFNPPQIVLYGTAFWLVIEYWIVHIGLFMLTNRIVFLITLSYLILCFLLGYGYLLIHLKTYIKKVFKEEII